MEKYNVVRAFMNITKAPAEENRVTVVLALRRGELGVSEIIAFLGFQLDWE